MSERILLFVLNELERLRLLQTKLEAAGVITPELSALVALEAEARQQERRIQVEGSSDALTQQLADLKRRIAALTLSPRLKAIADGQLPLPFEEPSV